MTTTTLSKNSPYSLTSNSPHEKDLDWRRNAACLGVDSELFFPTGDTEPAEKQIHEAKQVCSRCVVKKQCLQWAIDNDQHYGVWGGLSENERRALKRRTARNQPGTTQTVNQSKYFSDLP